MSQLWRRRARFALMVTAGAMALIVGTASPAAASPLFCGASRGPTAEVAIQGALWDAQSSAQSEGFYGACTIVGEPSIFETRSDPNFGHIFRASLTATCQS
jgi:hypothetical protein